MSATPAVLSAQDPAALRAEIEGLAAKLDVAEAMARGQARLLDLLETVLAQAGEIARLTAALKESEAVRAAVAKDTAALVDVRRSLEMYAGAWLREIRRAWPNGHRYHAGHHEIDCLVVWTKDAVEELLGRRGAEAAYQWRGDGTDDLTTCPTTHVLITPEQLQALVSQARLPSADDLLRWCSWDEDERYMVDKVLGALREVRR